MLAFSLLVSAALSEPVADHEIVLQDDELAITTRWSTDAVVDRLDRIVLLVPLPAEVRVVGATAERDAAGDVTAIVLAEPRLALPEVELRIAFDPRGGLPLPVARGSEIQRVRLSGDLRFLPDASLGLVAHLGHTTPATWGRAERVAVDRHVPGPRPRIGGLYVTTAAIVRAGGVFGELEPSASGRRRAALGIAVVFVVVCGATAWGYRRARRHAEAEHAELVLAAEFDGLGTDESQQEVG